MKIALVASNWRPISSAEKNVFAPGLIILELADRLVERGHEVTLFAPKNTITRAKLISEGLNSVYEDYLDLLYSDLPTFLKIEQQYEMVLLSKAFEMAQQKDFDVVHVHKTNIEPYFSNLINCPMVITSHNSYLIGKSSVLSPADKIRLKKYGQSCYYTALSKFIAGEVPLNFLGIVGNGIDLDQYKFDSKGNETMLFVGRLIQSKGPDVAVKLAEELKKPIQVVGDIRAGKDDKTFGGKLVEKINQSKFAKYQGFIPHSEISSVFSNAKLLLFPISEPEGFGLTIIESMACGTPVVAYNLGAVSEIIEDGKNGFLCPPGDYDSLIKAAEKIYNLSDEAYKQMRLACRKKVSEKYTLDLMVSGYEEIYKKAVQEWKDKRSNNLGGLI